MSDHRWYADIVCKKYREIPRDVAVKIATQVCVLLEQRKLTHPRYAKIMAWSETCRVMNNEAMGEYNEELGYPHCEVKLQTLICNCCNALYDEAHKALGNREDEVELRVNAYKAKQWHRTKSEWAALRKLQAAQS